MSSLLLQAARRLGGGTTPPVTGTVDPLAADPSAALYAIPTGPYNTPMPVITPTYDGSGEAIHPSVIDFHRIPSVGTNWHGWRYWMAMTPYPNADPSKENPSILVSNNGFYWQPPVGVRSPLYWPQPGTSNPVLSDTHLVYEPDRDGLLLLYRDNGLGQIHLIARSTDGVTWPTASTQLNFSFTQMNVSPCICRLSATDWRLFGISRETREIMTWKATDPFGVWQGPYLTLGITTASPWHLDVQWDGTKFTALIDKGAYGNPDGYASATSADGMHWTQGAIFMDVRAAPEWDSRQLYRACHTRHEDGGYRVWYSASKLLPAGSAATSQWGTAQTVVPAATWPAPPTLTTGTGTAYRDAVLSDAPEVFWRLGELYDDPVAADSSGHARPGVWSGGRTRVTGLCPDEGYASKVARSSITRSRETWMGSASYTAEVIVSGGSTSSNVTHTYVGIDDAGARGWYLGRRAGYLRWESPQDGLVLEAAMAATAKHVAVTVGGGFVRLYINGSVAASLSASPTAPPGAAALTVANSPFGGLAATIDEVAVYSTALTAARILAHATAAGLV